jgi:Fe-S-cluster containining protein
MDIHFDCTMCGKCCHDLKLPLGVDEAIAWLRRGDDIQILCEAVPWPEEPAADNLPAQHKKRRSFPALSGDLPTRIVVILAASFEGACPQLQPDLRCGIYEERPRVCRIYPAEINPFIPLVPEQKACPPEAWSASHPVFIKGGQLVRAETLALIEESRSIDAADTMVKAAACALLGINAAALANEGFVVHSPRRDLALAALEQARGRETVDEVLQDWRFVSNRRETVATLGAVGAEGSLVTQADASAFEYLGFFPAS